MVFIKLWKQASSKSDLNLRALMRSDLKESSRRIGDGELSNVKLSSYCECDCDVEILSSSEKNAGDSALKDGDLEARRLRRSIRSSSFGHWQSRFDFVHFWHRGLSSVHFLRLARPKKSKESRVSIPLSDSQSFWRFAYKSSILSLSGVSHRTRVWS